MYKNLIREIAEQEANKRKEEQKQAANQKRIKKAKYDISNLYVGYISKFITGYYNGRTYLKQLTNHMPRIFRKTGNDIFQDIETEKVYPILMEKQTPHEDENYIVEDNLQLFEVACMEILESQELETNAKLTKLQLRAILDKQTKLDKDRYLFKIL